MAIFLDPTGRTTFGIGICGRCSRKMFLEQLHPDPNSPGLMVCEEDLDDLDPYRLPARQTENINLPFVRPDVPLNVSPEDEEVEIRITEDDEIRETQDGNDDRILERP